MTHVASQDDLVVRNAIQQLGVNASVEWIRQCIEFRRTQQVKGAIPFSSTSTQDIANFVYHMYLLADFRILEATPILPSTVTTPHRQRLFTNHGTGEHAGVILQILQIQDISNSSLTLLERCEAVGVMGDQSGGFQVGKALPRGMCALDLTDGVRKIRAIAMEPIPEIAMEMKLGAKIRVWNAEVRHGVLQLYPTNAAALGGEVASMNKYPRRLVIMNQMREKLGYPLDPYPTSLAGSPTSALTTTTTPLTFGDPARPQSTSWTNPRPAVTAQDAVPSNTTKNTFAAPPRNTATNPFKPLGRANSPDNEALFYEEQQEQKLPEPQPWEIDDFDPNWDYDPAMDMDFNMDVDEPPKPDNRSDPFDDDFDIPEDVTDWEVLSQLSVDDSGPPPKPAPITDDAQRQQSQDSNRNKIKENSPPLIATVSPAKRGLTKRLPNLKAPRAGESSHLEISEWSVSKSSSQAESAQDSTSMSKRGRLDLKNGDEYASKKEKKSNESSFSANRRSVSPERVVIKQESNEFSRHKRQQEEVMDSDDDFTTSHVPPVFVLSDSNKKYTFGSQRDEHARRERSRSGSVSHWVEEVSRPKKDQPSGMAKVKTEPGLGILDHDTGLRKVKQEPTDEGLRSTSTTTTSTSMKATVITSRTGNERATGSSVHAAIDLLSDDDDDDNDDNVLSDATYGFSTGHRSLHSPMKRIKTELGSAIAAVTTVDLVAIKKEEVMLEFDMDDDDDFGCLQDLTKETPLVPLEEVQSNIDKGREVRTKAQISRLGKFSLTTLAMSIPVYLQPLQPGSGEAVNGTRASTTVEVVLDQSAIETLMECTAVEFRDLVRVDEARARQLVQNFRLKLQDVDTIECRLMGQRSGVPVIRELEILSRKPPKS
ncbi:recQ-mediated genome instability protein 1 [Podila verticillata]|nr:recQ-mediated genome instability protein 1 [Podila verticillata]